MKAYLQVVANYMTQHSVSRCGLPDLRLFLTTACHCAQIARGSTRLQRSQAEAHRLASCFEGWVGSGSSRIGLGQHFWALRRCLVGEDDGFEVKTEIKYSCK
jgi:hypothetical protein